MNKKIKNQTVQEFLDDLVSKTPAPGGGSVAALMGATAASLVSMVCNLTIGKKKYAKIEGLMRYAYQKKLCLSRFIFSVLVWHYFQIFQVLTVLSIC